MLFNKKPADDAVAVMAALRQSNPGPFKQALEEVHKSGGGLIWIMKRETVNAVPAIAKGSEEIAVSEAILDPNFLGTSFEQFKDGIYTFRIFDSKGMTHSDHHFAHGDIKTKRQTAKDSDKSDKAAVNNQTALMQTFMETQARQMEKQTEQNSMLMMQMLGNGNGHGEAFTMKDMLELQTRMMEANAVTTAKMMEMQQQQIANLQQGGGSPLDDALAIIQISQSINQPQIEREEPMTALLSSIMPLIAQFAGRKGSGPQSFNPDQLDEIQRLQKQVAALGSSLGTNPPEASLEAPGETAAKQPAQTPVENEQVPPQEQDVASKEGEAIEHQSADRPALHAGTQEYFDMEFVKRFQRHIFEGQEPEDLAYELVGMITHARDRMSDNPPPLMVGFLGADGALAYDAALSQFFDAIPELDDQKELRKAIRAALIVMFTKPAAVIPDEDAQDAKKVIEYADFEERGSDQQSEPDSAEDSSRHRDEAISG